MIRLHEAYSWLLCTFMSKICVCQLRFTTFFRRESVSDALEPLFQAVPYTYFSLNCVWRRPSYTFSAEIGV